MNYKYTTIFGEPDEDTSEGEMLWGRVSTYFSIRKEIVGTSVPFLAKVQIYGGLGFNKHKVVPTMNLEMFESAFPDAGGLENALEQDFGNNDIADQLADYMLENVEKISGFHLQVGAQAKLLILNTFVNARYTLAKDVIQGKDH